jgi:hypothetical protein
VDRLIACLEGWKAKLIAIGFKAGLLEDALGPDTEAHLLLPVGHLPAGHDWWTVC